MRTSPGLSLLELLVVVSVAAVLLGIGFVQINTGASATNQAARALAAAVNQARFEAVRTNNVAWITIVADDGTQSGVFRVCGREDAESTAVACGAEGARLVNEVALSGSALGRARIASPETLTVFFDRRGVVRNPSSSGLVITITDRGGANTRTVTVLPTGRTQVE